MALTATRVQAAMPKLRNQRAVFAAPLLRDPASAALLLVDKASPTVSSRSFAIAVAWSPIDVPQTMARQHC
eukprot:4125852-Amphidinium_carterae.1